MVVVFSSLFTLKLNDLNRFFMHIKLWGASPHKLWMPKYAEIGGQLALAAFVKLIKLMVNAV